MKDYILNNKNIMVGDWVKLNYDVCYKTGKSIYTPVQVIGINKDGTIDVNCTIDKSKSMQDGWDLKLIEPIPLISEIFEKNGFKKNTSNTKMCLDIHEYRLIYNLTNRLFTIFNESEGIILVQKPIVTVHKLQHALKLCEIDKEIKL